MVGKPEAQFEWNSTELRYHVRGLLLFLHLFSAKRATDMVPNQNQLLCTTGLLFCQTWTETFFQTKKQKQIFPENKKTLGMKKNQKTWTDRNVSGQNMFQGKLLDRKLSVQKENMSICMSNLFGTLFCPGLISRCMMHNVSTAKCRSNSGNWCPYVAVPCAEHVERRTYWFALAFKSI